MARVATGFFRTVTCGLLAFAALAGVAPGIAHAQMYWLPTTISAANSVDAVYNDTNDIIYITAGNQILRYDYPARRFLSPWIVGTKLMGADVSADGMTLAVADDATDGAQGWFWLVDTTTGGARKVRYDLGFMEGGTYTVAFDYRGNVMFSTRDGGGWVVPRVYKPAESTITVIPEAIRYDSMLSASADRKRIGWAEPNISNGEMGTYLAETGDIMRTTVDRPDYEVAVSSTGTYTAVPTYGGLHVLGPALNPLGVIPAPTIGVAFQPHSDVLFATSAGSSAIVAYDPATRAPLGALDAGVTLGWPGNYSFVPGRLRSGGGGSLLLLKLGDGFRVIQTNFGPISTHVRWTSPSTGRLLAGDGQPIAQATVAAQVVSAATTVSIKPVKTGADGSFALSLPASRQERRAVVTYLAADGQGAQGIGSAAFVGTTSTGPSAPLDLGQRIVRTPSAARLTLKRRRGIARVTLGARITDADGSPIPHARLWLQTSRDGRHWTTGAAIQANSAGRASRALRFKRRGTTYVRWLVAASAPLTKATGAVQRIVVR